MITILCSIIPNAHSKRRPKLVFKTNYRLMQVKSIAECSPCNILQYVLPSFSYHLSLRSMFCLFLSGHVRQVLLYILACIKRLATFVVMALVRDKFLCYTHLPLKPIFPSPSVSASVNISFISSSVSFSSKLFITSFNSAALI